MIQNDEGYAIEERVFGRAAVVRTLESLARADITRTRAGARHVLGVPAVRELSFDPRLVDIAARFVGPHPVADRTRVRVVSSA
jgi:hypothetical protein